MSEKLNISEIRKRCDSCVDAGPSPGRLSIKKLTSVIAEFYSSLSYFSSYGPKFQRVTNLYYNRDEVLASINGIDTGLAE